MVIRRSAADQGSGASKWRLILPAVNQYTTKPAYAPNEREPCARKRLLDHAAAVW